MISIEDFAIFAKKKAFVYPSTEIYGGTAGFFEYGPLGVELKNNIKQNWWQTFVKNREDVVGIDGNAAPKDQLGTYIRLLNSKILLPNNSAFMLY